MEELLKQINAKLDGIMGLLTAPEPEKDEVVSTPFGKYKMNPATGKREKVEFINGEWVAVPGIQVDPVATTRLTPQLNFYPWPGMEYKKYEGAIPDGFHIEYDYANKEEVLCRTCGKLGTR